MKKIRIAFIKFGGLTAGGTERWLQMMAANLNPERFQADYYYCDTPGTDRSRLLYLEQKGLRVIRFNVGARDLKSPTWIWRDTDFWRVFKEEDYDLVQTAKSRGAEYPFCLMKIPVVEYRTLMGLPDPTPNCAFSIHLSQWQRTEWFLRGGDLAKSAVIPIPTEPPATNENFRDSLKIPADAVVAGFHQRADDAIYSPIPLSAFAQIKTENAYFVIMGGSALYKEQARRLGIVNIRFIDHSSGALEISRFLNTLDIFAHGRKDGETFGTVFAEALIHGKPCLSHRAPQGANGQEETMGPAGLFADNESDYLLRLKTLYDSDAFRRQLAGKARLHAEKYFLIDKAVGRLERIYQSFIDRIPQTEEASSYGKSPLGFFYYGPTENPASVAAHVVTRTIPEIFGLHMMRQFKDAFCAVLDAGITGGLYGFSAAHENPQCQVIIYEPETEGCSQRRETVWLNNWESRVSIAQTASVKSGGPFDFVTIDAASFGLDKLDITQEKPALLIENPIHFRGFEGLREKGYTLWRCTEEGRCVEIGAGLTPEKGTLLLALHREKHRTWIAQMPSLALRYRRDKLLKRFRKYAYLSVKALRHPRRAWEGIRRCRQTPHFGWRF